jgi:hypothetical protein
LKLPILVIELEVGNIFAKQVFDCMLTDSHKTPTRMGTAWYSTSMDGAAPQARRRAGADT